MVSTGPTTRERPPRGWPASYPIAQPPNPPVLVATGGWLVAGVARGPIRSVARAVFLAGLATWAWREIADGENGVRRAFGAVGMAHVVAKLGLGRQGG